MVLKSMYRRRGPCPDGRRGRREEGSHPPACTPDPTRVLPPLLSESKSSTHPRMHTTSPAGLEPRVPTGVPACSRPASQASGDPQRQSGGRGDADRPPATLGQFWSFSEPSLGLFPQLYSGQSLSASPTPASRHRDRREGQEGAFGDLEALGGGGRGPENPWAPGVPRSCRGAVAPPEPQPDPPQLGLMLDVLEKGTECGEGGSPMGGRCSWALGDGGGDREAEGLGACSTPCRFWGGRDSSS